MSLLDTHYNLCEQCEAWYTLKSNSSLQNEIFVVLQRPLSQGFDYPVLDINLEDLAIILNNPRHYYKDTNAFLGEFSNNKILISSTLLSLGFKLLSFLSQQIDLPVELLLLSSEVFCQCTSFASEGPLRRLLLDCDFSIYFNHISTALNPFAVSSAMHVIRSVLTMAYKVDLIQEEGLILTKVIFDAIQNEMRDAVLSILEVSMAGNSNCNRLVLLKLLIEILSFNPCFLGTFRSINSQNNLIDNPNGKVDSEHIPIQIKLDNDTYVLVVGVKAKCIN